jgi:hypothetical protein
MSEEKRERDRKRRRAKKLFDVLDSAYFELKELKDLRYETGLTDELLLAVYCVGRELLRAHSDAAGWTQRQRENRRAYCKAMGLTPGR